MPARLEICLCRGNLAFGAWIGKIGYAQQVYKIKASKEGNIRITNVSFGNSLSREALTASIQDWSDERARNRH